MGPCALCPSVQRQPAWGLAPQTWAANTAVLTARLPAAPARVPPTPDAAPVGRVCSSGCPRARLHTKPPRRRRPPRATVAVPRPSCPGAAAPSLLHASCTPGGAVGRARLCRLPWPVPRVRRREGAAPRQNSRHRARAGLPHSAGAQRASASAEGRTTMKSWRFLESIAG